FLTRRVYHTRQLFPPLISLHDARAGKRGLQQRRTRRFSAGFSPAMRATLNRRRMFQSRYTHSWNILMRAIASVRATPPFRYIEHPFDKRHGLDTAGYLSKRDLVTGHPNDVYLTGYSAVAPSVF